MSPAATSSSQGTGARCLSRAASYEESKSIRRVVERRCIDPAELNRICPTTPKHLDIVMDMTAQELYSLLVRHMDAKLRDIVPMIVEMATSVGPCWPENFRRWCFRQGIDECFVLVSKNRLKFECCAKLPTAESLVAFSELLAYGATVTKLDLSDSHCRLESPANAEMLSDALIGNESLQTLRLSNCGITDVAAEYLLYSLSTCERLRDIDLSFNPMGGYAIEFMAEALYENPAIRYIHLEGIYFGREAAEILLHALEARGDVYVELSLEYFEATLEEDMFNRLKIYQMDKFSYLDWWI